MTSSIGMAQPELYESQFAHKVEKTQSQFSAYLKEQTLETYTSPASHFRMRAEFRIWHQDGRAHYAMYEPGEYKKPVIINTFTIGSEAICELMPKLLNEINSTEVLKYKLFSVEFLTTLSNQTLVTLIYHKALDDDWLTQAKALQQGLNCAVIGRSRKQKCVLSQDFVTETLALDNGSYNYQQIETGFTQPNARVCIDMLNWCTRNSMDFGGDLLELYCGNGNFTLPLSRNFNKVMATEVSKLSTRAAKKNIDDNKIDNISLVRLSAEEVCQAIYRVREFRRLKDIDIGTFNFSTVLVDPPRAGLDAQTLKFVAGFQYIIYISCNPETLEDNLKHLQLTHRVDKFALFDQFPYTEHRECGVILTRL